MKKNTVVWSDGDLIKEKIYIYLAFYFVSTFFCFPSVLLKVSSATK